MHCRVVQLKEVESDVSAEHVAKSNHCCCLFTMRSLLGNRRMRNQPNDKGLGIGSDSQQRQQLRWYRYR